MIRRPKNNIGSHWFRRFVRECEQISPYIEIRRIKYGFYRIYWKQAYIHEIYKEMPVIGFDIEEDDVAKQESQKLFEEYEDSSEITRKVKNYYEGYWDSIDRIKTRVYMLKNDNEFYENARKAYQNFTVK
jgi:hypothetical protein